MTFKRVNTIDPDKSSNIGPIVAFIILLLGLAAIAAVVCNSGHAHAHRYYIVYSTTLTTFDHVGVTAWINYGDSASRGDYRIIGNVVASGPIRAVDSIINAVRASAEAELQLCIKYHIQ